MGGRPSGKLPTPVLTAVVATVAALVALSYIAHVWGGSVQQSREAYGSYVVRVGTLRGGVSSLDVIVVADLSSKHGVQIEPLLFTSTLDLANALSRGDIDVAVIPVEFVAKLREKGVNVTVLAVDFYQNQALVARKGLAESVSDLRGRPVGVFKPTGTYAMFRAYMRVVYGVDSENYFKLVNMPPPQLVQAFQRGDVDAVVVWEPFVSKLVADYNGSIVVDYGMLWKEWSGHVGDRGVMVVYAARAEWAYGHPQVVERLLQARSDAARLWNTNETLAVSILVENYGLSKGAAELCWQRLRMEEAVHLTDSMVRNIIAVWELAREGGYISSSPEELAGPGAFWAGW